MFGSRLVSSPLQGRQTFFFRPLSCHQHNRCSAVLVLPQQSPRWVLHLRQRSKISMTPLLTHKLRPANPSHLFCIANKLLTYVVRQIYLMLPRNMSRPLGVWLQGLHLRRLPLICSSRLRIGVGGGMGARPHGRGGVCGQYRERTFCSPADFLGDRRHGR